MSTIKSYRDLEAWQRGMELAVEVYPLTRRMPAEERFGLTSQVRRAATSVPANIAEGHGRATTGDFLQSLSVSRGSLAEVKTWLELSVRLKYHNRDEIQNAWTLAETTGKLVNGLIRAVRPRKSRRRPQPPTPNR